MKKLLFTLLLILILSQTQAQDKSQTSSIGINIVPLILNKTLDLQYDLKLDSTKFLTFSLGTTINNHQDYAFCIQCPLRPKILELDAYSIKVNYRKTVPTKKDNLKYFGVGLIGSYYEKKYLTELIPNTSGSAIRETKYRNRLVGFLNIQIGKSYRISNRVYWDFGIQLSTPIKYRLDELKSNIPVNVVSEEPQHYTPTRGMLGLNFYSILKFSTKSLSK